MSNDQLQERLVKKDDEWATLINDEIVGAKPTKGCAQAATNTFKGRPMTNVLEDNKRWKQMKTFEELMEGSRAMIFIDETKKVKDAFKPYEKYGTVKVIPPDVEDGEDFFNVTVELKYPITSDTINKLNKSISSKVTFSDSGSTNGSCEIGSIRGNVILEFFVDIPE